MTDAARVAREIALTLEAVKALCSCDLEDCEPTHEPTCYATNSVAVDRIAAALTAAQEAGAAPWRNIVKGVHGALLDAGTVPVPDLEADLYETVMAAIRAAQETGRREERARLKAKAASSATGPMVCLCDDCDPPEASPALRAQPPKDYPG